MSESRSVVWVDANGKNTITRIRTGTGAGPLQSAILAASNADFVTFWESAETTNGAPTPTAATYQPAQPYAQLSYLCADNTIATVLIPAPRLSIFLADQETVNPASPSIVALNGAAIAVGGLVGASGSPAVSFLGGKILPYRGAA